uniref:DET1- and DDB1-associated protein 1 domain-containing protein n=1 Tax=Setaria italica TaxID=4555 RepID=K3ZDJ5_SETIT
MGADGRGSGGRKGSSPAKPAEGRTSSLLAGLPSRGNFTESDVASSMGGLKVYICLHDTAPPEGQVVKTDTNNILIRALQLSKHKSEAKDMSSKMPGESSRGKRRTEVQYISLSSGSLVSVLCLIAGVAYF